MLKQVENICDASRLLLDGVKTGNFHQAHTGEKIKLLESKGDEIIHDIIIRLHQTFITPLDPEDIHKLSSNLDDVLDAIEDAAHRMTAYRIDPFTPTIIELCEMVHHCTRSVQHAFEALGKDREVMEHCIEINRIEDEADKLVRRAVSDLFRDEKDPIALIKLKEVYEFLESTTDYCEDVADTLQAVVVKNS